MLCHVTYTRAHSLLRNVVNHAVAQGWLWKTGMLSRSIGKKKSMIREMLPEAVEPIQIERWWLTNIGYVTEACHGWVFGFWIIFILFFKCFRSSLGYSLAWIG